MGSFSVFFYLCGGFMVIKDITCSALGFCAPLRHWWDPI